jgi:beta-glucosidase
MKPPKNPAPQFLWGAATSSHQIEGHNERNDWWAWEAKGNIEGGARSGAATDHFHRFREDLRLAAELGLTSYRFSVEWSRIEPEEGRFDPDAIEWYRELIAECERHGLLPMLTLHHFTCPQWLAEQGSFAWDGAPERFARYVRKIVEELGARVPLWCTINEPGVLVVGAYLARIMPPARFSKEEAANACRNLLRAHALAYDIIHAPGGERSGPWKDHPVQVGLAHNMLDFCADRWWDPREQLLARFIGNFYNRSWLDAVTGRKQRFGVPGILPSPPEVTEARGRRTVDFIGVNYYTKGYVQWRRNRPSQGISTPLPVNVAFARPREAQSDLGWAIHPKGFGRVLRLAASYGLPLYVTENGIADREDAHRAEYLRLHIEELQGLRSEGLDIRGYYHWSLLDNFEWVKGFGPCFGLYAVDYATFDRTPRQSALTYREIITNS